jgi:CRISPR-associated protein Cas1
MILAAENQIPLIICNNYGKPVVRMWTCNFLNTSAIRRKQYKFCESPESLGWAKEIILKKTDGQLANLKFLEGRRKVGKEAVLKAAEKVAGQSFRLEQLADLPHPEAKKQLLNYEAYAASVYWQTAGLKFPPPYSFYGRVKKNPVDAFNACINYLYGILRSQVETAILSFGLDPALGVFHRDGYRMPSLVFDMMEPFRPVVDRFLFKAILDGSLPENMIIAKDTLASISKEGRQALIRLFIEKLDSRVQVGECSISFQSQIFQEVKFFTERVRKT